jgi:hypothetical protein
MDTNYEKCFNIIQKKNNTDITPSDFLTYINSYQIKINYFYNLLKSKEDKTDILNDFNYYIIDDYISIDFLNYSTIDKLYKIIDNISISLSIDFIKLINYKIISNDFIRTIEFLKNDTIKKIYTVSIINDF